MSSIHGPRRGGRSHMPATVWAVLVAFAMAVTLLLMATVIFLVATSPNWVGH